MPASVPQEGFLRRLVRQARYRYILRFRPRQNRVYTQFHRFPHQYTAIAERVLPFLRPAGPCAQEPLEIVIFGCCTGAEPFSLASFLHHRAPGLAFRIRGFDIVESAIEKARTATYTRQEVFEGPFVNEAFVAETFAVSGDTHRVRPEIASRVTFATASLLDEPFMRSLGRHDMVFAQNVLFHLPPPDARRAFTLLLPLLKPRAALFVNGMDTDMRVELTQRHGLEPLEHLIEEIHNDARVDRGERWSTAYWGREPFSRRPRHWQRKYGTIFLTSQP